MQSVHLWSTHFIFLFPWPIILWPAWQHKFVHSLRSISFICVQMHIYTWCYFYCFRILVYDGMIIEPCNTIQMSKSFQQFVNIGVSPVCFQRMWARQLWACDMLWLMSWYQLITLFTYFSYFAWVAIVLYANLLTAENIL